MATTSYASAAGQQKMYYINIKQFFNFFEQPDEETVAAAAKAIFPADPALGFSPMRGRMEGYYRVASTTEPTVHELSLSRARRDGQSGEEIVAIPLQTQIESGGGQRKGTLVTIVDGDLGPARSIPGSAFDAVLGQYGEVVMMTKPQTNKITGLATLNKMCVVDTERSTIPLPDRITVDDKSFLIRYKGKKWLCRSCNAEHVGQCPYKKEFYAALEYRKSLEMTHSLVGDSTLRLADHAGLRADVVSMPGATVGQLATAIEQMENYPVVTLVAGANDVKSDKVDSEFILAKQIDQSISKLERTLKRKSKTKFTIFNASPPIRNETSPMDKFGRQYLKDRLRKSISPLANAQMISPVRFSEEWSPDGHPTRQCTEELLRGLTTAHSDLIINDNFLTQDILYKGVRKCWVSGCSGCESRGYFHRGGFCASCHTKIHEDDDYEDLDLAKKLSSKIFKEDFPARIKRRNDSFSSSDSCEPEAKQPML